MCVSRLACVNRYARARVALVLLLKAGGRHKGKRGKLVDLKNTRTYIYPRPLYRSIFDPVLRRVQPLLPSQIRVNTRPERDQESESSRKRIVKSARKRQNRKIRPSGEKRMN